MVRKCRGIAEIAVMEVAQVGVRTTRAREGLASSAAAAAAAATTTAAKRRKLNAGDLNSPSSSSPYVPLVITPAENDERCSSPSSVHAAMSCCSSNGSSSLAEEVENFKFVDLQDDNSEVETSTYSCYRERRETTPSSELESTARPTPASTRRRSTVEKSIMPTESELEEFFSAAEKDLQKRFKEKYNYDIVKDAPLEGRYEWIRLKP
ncbi:cyclin-dependent kinase inhibitor 7-like [Quercus robur]|uniref:cyclin-dependent kinase inhibitor 7-like n=1 Tax=Quercus robur TaxID=38942 RepID=UPI002163DA12|nr:cyclin-dependent kinase inhibitor 7-like [Quercus robur]